jgi:hypothetical protein
MILHDANGTDRHAEPRAPFRQDCQKRLIVFGFVKDRLLTISTIQQVKSMAVDQIPSSSWHDSSRHVNAKLCTVA